MDSLLFMNKELDQLMNKKRGFFNSFGFRMKSFFKTPLNKKD